MVNKIRDKVKIQRILKSCRNREQRRNFIRKYVGFSNYRTLFAKEVR